MGVSWTTEQKQVIDTRGCNLLVSAAAGSGKTAVLVARILELITDEAHPVDIDQLLVVTFTRAAAGEMRDRISAAIEERLLADPDNAHLQQQSVLLHNAKISTIHGFCTYVIQNYFYRTDLDPAYRIADEGELKEVRAQAMEALLEESYTEASPQFLDFVEVVSPGKHDKKLEEAIGRVYDFSMANPDPSGWLASCREAAAPEEEASLLRCVWMTEVTAETVRILESARLLAEENCRLAGRADGPEQYLPMAQADLELLDDLLCCASYPAYQQAFADLAFMRLSAKKPGAEQDPELQKRFRDNREQLKKTLQDLQKNLYAQTIPEILADLARIRPQIGELTRLAEAFGARFTAEKRARNIVDFTDLEHYALRILAEPTEDGWQRTEAAAELSERFAEIMIDEYQDSNLLQETILNAVSGTAEGRNNRFMVGDMKQSIYGFRMARPELFLEKYHTYPPLTDLENKGVSSGRITLGKNFRSRPEVLDFTNAVFERIMQPDLGGIRYDADAALYQGASYPADESGQFPAELLLLNKQAPEFEDDRSKETMIEAEAMLIASRIQELLQHGKVTDKATGALRPVEYRDIVILLRSASGSAGVYARALQSVGIPSYATSRKGYFSATEVVTVLNYLRILDNPRQEIPFAAILRSPVCGCTDEELAQLCSTFPGVPVYEAAESYAEKESLGETPLEEGLLREKLRRFLAIYDDLRAWVPHCPVHEIIQQVLERTGYGLIAASMPAGEQRDANLKMLVETAVSYEKTSFHGLFHFVRYIERLGSYNVDYGEVNLFGEGENTVRIMTIHKSKGLEFPVVFLSGLSGQFNFMDLNDSVVQHARLGIGMDVVDPELRIKHSSLLRQTIRNAMRRDMLGEELRVLYVALTRAKEKLILTAAADDPEKRIGMTAEQSYLKRSGAKSYLDWILMALTKETPVDIRVIEPSEIGEAALTARGQELEHLQTLREMVAQKLEKRQDLRPDSRMDTGSGQLFDGGSFSAGRSRADVSDADGVNLHGAMSAEELRVFLREKNAFRYPYQALAKLPAKLSVSEIKRRAIEEQEERGEELYREEPVVPLIPAFLREQVQGVADTTDGFSGAARGTIYHRVLAGLDLSKFSEARDPETGTSDLTGREFSGTGASDLSGELSRQMRRMAADGKLTEQEISIVRMGDLLRFVRSPVCRRMQAAAARGTLMREQPFVIDIPANEINSAWQETEPILVQGVIDAYFRDEDGDYVIVDYKTDRVHSRDGRDLAEKYRVQLQYYRRALEQILAVRVKELCLYSVALGREIYVQQ